MILLGVLVAVCPAGLRLSSEPPEGGQVHEFLNFKVANHATVGARTIPTGRI